MQRADQHTQQQIADLVNACAGYWELRGIEHARNNEMQLELEQHLQQAVQDGKSLGAVLGLNPLGLAEAWAREMHPHFWRGGTRCLSGLVYVLSIVSTTALISQLLSRTPAFTLSIFAAYLLTGSGLLALLLQLGGFLALRVRTRAGREGLMLSGAVLAVLILRLAGIKVNWSMALLSWSWPITVLLLILAAFLFPLEAWRTSHREHTSSVRRVPMFVASVAIVDFCRLALRLM
jgi:hypothetical protein